MAEVLAKPGFRKAAANLGWLFAERAGRFVLGTVVGLFVARHLGPERLGALSYGVALVTLAGFVPALGLDGILKRELLQAPERTAPPLPLLSPPPPPTLPLALPPLPAEPEQLER